MRPGLFPVSLALALSLAGCGKPAPAPPLPKSEPVAGGKSATQWAALAARSENPDSVQALKTLAGLW